MSTRVIAGGVRDLIKTFGVPAYVSPSGPASATGLHALVSAKTVNWDANVGDGMTAVQVRLVGAKNVGTDAMMQLQEDIVAAIMMPEQLVFGDVVVPYIDGPNSIDISLDSNDRPTCADTYFFTWDFLQR